MPPLPPVTKFLMLTCTAVYCLQVLFQLLPLPVPVQLLALWPLNSGNFWPWQVVTYAFLHGGMLHLLLNMLGLWSFGCELERLWGQKRYIYFLLASVLSAAAAQLLFTWLTHSFAPTVGASGGLYGLLLAYGMLFPNRTIMLLIPPIPMKAKVYVVVFGGIELLSGLSGPSGVAHFAHLGGMLGGYLMIRYWRGQPPFGGRGKGGGKPPLRRVH